MRYVRNHGSTLGCTHYAFLRAAFERELGSNIAVIEPSEAVARRVAAVLEEQALRNARVSNGRVEYLCSGDSAAFDVTRARLMKEGATVTS